MSDETERPESDATGRSGSSAASGRSGSSAASGRSGSLAARGAWMASGVTFFMVGVVFTLTMPDNFAIGITFLALGVVFFSLAGTKRAPGDGTAPVSQADHEPAAHPTPGEVSGSTSAEAPSTGDEPAGGRGLRDS